MHVWGIYVLLEQAHQESGKCLSAMLVQGAHVSPCLRDILGYLCTLWCKPRFFPVVLPSINTHGEQSITMARQPSSDTVTLFCWIIGESASFRVDIHRNGYVDDLKASLINRKSRYWGNIETTRIEVFLANIPDTDGGREEFMFKRRSDKVLAGSKKIASLFENDPPEDTIHVAVQSPRQASSTRSVLPHH